MELQQAYNQVMNGCVNMALATSVDGRPNVRVVTFGYDDKQEGKLYFCTFKGNRKTEEFAANDQVACLPLPMGPEADAQVRIFGKVQKSTRSMGDLIQLIAKKMPGDAQTMEDGGDMMEIYEVSFTEAWVTVGMTAAERYAIG